MNTHNTIQEVLQSYSRSTGGHEAAWQAMGVSRPSYYRWVAGKTLPSYPNLIKIHKVTHIPITELVLMISR